MTAPVLFAPPSVYTLPLSLGQDLVVDFQRQDSTGGTPVFTDYDVGTTVTLQIDPPLGTTAVQLAAQAVITGYHAVVTVPSTTTDLIVKRVLWRAIITLPDGTHLVPVNGLVARYDGKQ